MVAVGIRAACRDRPVLPDITVRALNVLPDKLSNA
jgi:hypothetical protein